MNKYAYQPKFQLPQQSLTSYFVLRNNNSGKVGAKYVGKEANTYRNTSIWVPKFLVTNKSPSLIGDLNQATKSVLQAYSSGGVKLDA